jgi:hypothetical protein
VAILSAISEETCTAILEDVLAHPRPLTVLPETRGEGFITAHTPEFLEVKVLTECARLPAEMTVLPVGREGEQLICAPVAP